MVKCGVGVIIKFGNKVLVGKRKGSHGEGFLSFPGGHIDDTDNSLEECCKREVREEIGMDIDVIQDLFTTFDILSEDGSKRYLTPYMFAYYVSGGTFDGNHVEPLEPNKVDGRWFWVTLNELAAILKLDGRKEALQWIPINRILPLRKLMGL